MTMKDADPGDPVLTGDEVRNVKFGTGAYDASQVNALLDRIATELDAGRPAGPLIADARFRKRLPLRAFGRGYDSGAVDWFLEQLRRREDPAEADRMNADPWRDLAADPYCICREPGGLAGRIAAPSARAYAAAWDDFGHQPGTRLSWVGGGLVRRKLRTAEQQTVVSFGAGWSTTLSTIFCPGPGWVTTVNIGGRAFTLKQASARMVAINEIAARSRFDLRDFLDPKTGEPLPRAYEELSVRELLDDTGTRILYTSGRHFGLYAGAGVTFSDQRWLRFPVRGTNRANAIMTAVDQAGNKVARYRIIGPKLGQIIRGNTVEITVHPGQELTDGLVVAIAISAPWLSSYFAREGGGG